MANLKNPMLFFTTSPRSPGKMLPEIKLLIENFSDQIWNKSTQEQFAKKLEESDFFEGSTSKSDAAFSARDRITRAPKALGFINLSPKIEITNAGNELLTSKYPKEIFLRQLLKFQLPSPYHPEPKHLKGKFFIKPYLELMRLIRDLKYLTFDEVKIFVFQLIDYRKYEIVKNKILKFRNNKYKGKYKKYVQTNWDKEIETIFNKNFSNRQFKTRESNDSSLKNFMRTKRGTMRDYTDAVYRYLRYTGLITIYGKGIERGKISFFENKLDEVDYILKTVERAPVFCNDIQKYQNYLFNNTNPVLFTDNKDKLIDLILKTTDSYTKKTLINKEIIELKELREDIIISKREAILNGEIAKLKDKSYDLYMEITDTYNEIIADELFDAPLMLEWNTWRAMTMIDGGKIKGNFNIDDVGFPLSTAQGNMPDIECDYGYFSLSVEVTLQSGQRQYEAEGESVARHYGQIKKKTGKETFCLFIAPTINAATLAHFYTLNKTDILYYGGKSNIIPLHLEQFMKLIDNSYNYKKYPEPKDIYLLLKEIMKSINTSDNENDWFSKINLIINNWLI